MRVARDLLCLLGEAPFLDRLEAAALSGWSRGAVYAAFAALEGAGLVAPLPHAHASELLAPTQRYALTVAGLQLLRSRPLTAHWRRLLLERLDGVASIYRLAAAIAGSEWPLRFRWYRAQPMDAALALPDGRSLFVVREGPTADRTSFGKRLWRLREGPRPGACLLLVPDAVRLRHTSRLMARAPSPAFLALERDAVASGPDARVWRTAAGSPWLSLREVLSHVARRRAWPEEASLVERARDRLALSDRGLALLARRDRSAVHLALRRWSARPLDPDAPPTWRNVSGRRSRQLLRTAGHTAAVHGFLAALAQQARREGWDVAQLDPPHRASRYYRSRGAVRSIQPDAFAVLRREGERRPFFLEWERRAVRPSTMADRLAPYLRYYASQRPADDHGVRPTVLVVFDDELAAGHFLRVAAREMKRARVEVPLRVSHRALIEREGPLGAVWRTPAATGSSHPWSQPA